MSDIQIQVDSRERELYDHLKGQTDFPAASMSLEIGDIMIINSEKPLLIIERKTLSDLASSNRDGRYREQRARLLSMRGQGISICYLIEYGNGWNSELNRIFNGGVTEVLLFTLVTRLQLHYGIPVLTAKDVFSTSKQILQFCKMLKEKPDLFMPNSGIVADATAAASVYTEALSAQKSANRCLKRVGASMLSAIPGIGGKLSEGILDLCEGTLECVMKKSKEELALLKVGKRAVGKVAAEKIWTALHSTA
jgi:ERCC4-type nuclease